MTLIKKSITEVTRDGVDSIGVTEYINIEEALKEFLDNAVRSEMGSACD